MDSDSEYEADLGTEKRDSDGEERRESDDPIDDPGIVRGRVRWRQPGGKRRMRGESATTPWQ